MSASPPEQASASSAAVSGSGRRGRDRHTRRRLPVDRRREELIKVALELLSQDTPGNVSIDDIASAAGASRALVYHYFGSKQELYLAALRSAANDLSERVKPPQEGSYRHRLAVALMHYFDFVEEHAAGFAALLRGGPAYSAGDVGDVIEGVRGLILRQLFESMGVTDPSATLRATLRGWIGAVETAGLDWLEHRDLPRDALEGLFIDHLASMLAAAAQHDPDLASLVARLGEN